MTEQQIISEIHRYLLDKTYNYAVLIDGEWGSGKTYFVKNILVSEIEETTSVDGPIYDAKYISLYGCKTVSDIQENMVWELADEVREKFGAKIGKKKKKDTKSASKMKSGKVVLSSTRKIGNELIKKFLPREAVFDISLDWLTLKSYVFIFDDLERCDCPLNEVFGFINGLVEHEGTKVIIVANEKEITDAESISTGNIEEQYSLATSDRISWPQYEPPNYFERYQRKENGKLSIEELESRRELLFPTPESDGTYKKIREKVIGVSMKYDPNTSRIVEIIIEKTISEGTIKAALKRNIPFYISMMDKCVHHNLRTVQFFISKVTFLLQCLSQIDIEDEFKERVEDYVVRECFETSVVHKSNFKPKNDDFLLAFSNSDIDTFSSKAIRQYVETGTYDEESMHNDINLLVESKFKATIDSNDPFSILYSSNIYYIPQEECEDALAKFIERLVANKYPIHEYTNILITVVKIEDIGFPEEYGNRIRKAMIDNLIQMGTLEKIEPDLFMFDKQDAREKLSRYVAEINSAVENNSHTVKSCNIKDILKRTSWVEDLDNYANPKKNRGVEGTPFFIQADASEWIDAIMRSSSKEIHDFRSWMWRVYPQEYRMDTFEKDWPVLIEIHDLIDLDKEPDIIKRKALDYVKWQIMEIYRINTGTEYQADSKS